MLELMALGVVAAAVFAGLFVVLTILKLAFKLVLWPLLLIKWIVLALVFTVVGPVLLIAGLLVSFIVGTALLAPLLPFIALAALVWFLVRPSRTQALTHAR